MSIPATELQDCQIISKTFERGANFSVSEESVFAVMAPSICTMRNLAKSTKSLIKEDKLQDIPVDKDNDDSLLDRWTKGGLDGTDCIPCNLRINFKELLTFQSSINQLYDYYLQYFQAALKQIEAITKMLSGDDKLIDLCSMINYFKNFMCVPDLQRIIAAFTALIMQLGIELSSLFDLVLQLVGPIMMPFLNQVIAQVNKFFLMAIKPLECIVNSITSHISKLDYGAIFANPNLATVQNTFKVGGVTINKKRIVNPIANDQAIKDNKQIKDAETKLDKLKVKSSTTDITNQKEVEDINTQTSQAKQEYQEALRNKDLTAIGQTNAKLNEMLNTVRSSLFSLIKYIKMVIDKFNDFQNKLVGDFVKMLNTLMGGGTGLIIQLQDKLAIVQLIALIKSIIKIYKQGLDCPTGDTDSIAPILSSRSDALIYQDKDGNIHVKQNTSEIDPAIEATIKGFGKNPENAEDSAFNKLNSLITYTGNPILDSSISRIVKSLASPLDFTFKCGLQTSVADAEQVNQWISELNQV
jgi:hypothetical protein